MTTDTPPFVLFDDSKKIDEILQLAQVHGDQSGNEMQIGDLEDALRAAWRIMSPLQRQAMLKSEAVNNIAESVGVDSLLNDADEIDPQEYVKACDHYGFDTSFVYSHPTKVDIINHYRMEMSYEMLGLDAKRAELAEDAAAQSLTTAPKRRPRL